MEGSLTDKENFRRAQGAVFKRLLLDDYCFRILGIAPNDESFDWDIKRHKHAFFEFNYITEGVSHTSINGTDYTVAPAQFLFIPPGTFHSHRPGGHFEVGLRWDLNRERASHSSVSFVHSFARDLYSVLPGSYSDTDGLVLSLLTDLAKKSKAEAGILELQLLFFTLVMGIVNCCRGQLDRRGEGGAPDLPQNPQVNEAMQYIEERLSRPLAVAEIARHVNLSYSQLNRLFKKHNKKTMTAYISELRLSQAQHLLAGTQDSIAQIAESVGYPNENYFFNVFKSHFNTSPLKFRMSSRKFDE